MSRHRIPLLSLGAVVVIAAIAITFNHAKAATTITGFISRPAEAADLKGDNNGIGTFNSNEANKKLVKVWGTITAISDTEITVMSKWDPQNNAAVDTETSYSFTIDDTTKILRRFRALSSVAELTVGDQVRVWATKLTDGTAKLIWDKSIWWIRLTGTISNLDTTEKTFNLIITRMGSDDTENTFRVKVKTNDMTIYANADGTAAAFSDLENGDMVRVRGVWNHVGRYLTARNIKFQ